MKKQTVYTKGKVYEIMENFSNQVIAMKTVKEIREFVSNELPKFKPSARGRRSVVSENLEAIQALISEQAERVSGNDGKFLLGMVASAWNIKAAEGSTLLEANRLRSLVEANKLTLPERFTLPARQKRTRKATADATPEE